jgi:hypothetical protein
MVKRYNYKNPKPAQWHEGPRYDISVANNLLYTNRDWTRGKVTVFIKDKWDGNKIHQRTGDLGELEGQEDYDRGTARQHAVK